MLEDSLSPKIRRGSRTRKTVPHFQALDKPTRKRGRRKNSDGSQPSKYSRLSPPSTKHARTSSSPKGRPPKSASVPVQTGRSKKRNTSPKSTESTAVTAPSHLQSDPPGSYRIGEGGKWMSVMTSTGRVLKRTHPDTDPKPKPPPPKKPAEDGQASRVSVRLADGKWMRMLSDDPRYIEHLAAKRKAELKGRGQEFVSPLSYTAKQFVSPQPSTLPILKNGEVRQKAVREKDAESSSGESSYNSNSDSESDDDRSYTSFSSLSSSESDGETSLPTRKKRSRK